MTIIQLAADHRLCSAHDRACCWQVPMSKASQRRQQLRYRHSQSTDAKVESQFKKAIAARRPKPTVAGSSRIEALANRLDRTGSWTLSQYTYVSIGLALGVTLLLFLRSGLIGLALAVGIFVGADCRTCSSRGDQETHCPIQCEIPRCHRIAGARPALRPPRYRNACRGSAGGARPGRRGIQGCGKRIKIGRTMEAFQQTADRLDIPEFNFFCITLAIQRETGGNLAETLSNLSDVLRKRAQMKLKIKAMSSESKASAYIVGALPSSFSV